MLEPYWLWITAALNAWAIWTGNSLLILLTSLVLILQLSVWLWNRWSLAGVAFSRQVDRERALFGQKTEVTLEFLNLKPLPLPWLKVEDEIPKHLTFERGRIETRNDGSSRFLQNILAMMPYQRIVRRFPVVCSRRGVHTFGPVYMESGDYLGMLKKYKGLSDTHTLVVFPRVVPVLLNTMASNQIIGRDTIRRILHTDPVRTAGSRDYVAGDSYRSIDWRATARVNHLMVKVFEPSSSPLVDIVLNLSVPSSKLRNTDRDEAEFMISVGASLASYAAEKGWAVGIRANGISGSNPIVASASGAPGQLGKIMDLLASAHTIPFGSVLSHLSSPNPPRPAGTSVVLITMILNEEIMGALHTLSCRGWPATVVYAGPEARLELDHPLPFWHLPYSPNWTNREAYIFNG